MNAAPELEFSVEGAEAVRFAASPHLMLKLRIACPEGQTIHSVVLRCQIQLEVTRRRYSPDEQAKLYDLFGEPETWGRSLHNMMWTQANLNVSGFTGSTVADLPVPCTFDFNVASTKYFDALQDGDVPLCLLFSGTVFYAADHGALQVGQIPWEKEAGYRLPIRVWRDMIEQYYSNTAWLCLRKDVFDRLLEFKSRAVPPTWEQTIESLLLAVAAEEPEAKATS